MTFDLDNLTAHKLSTVALASLSWMAIFLHFLVSGVSFFNYLSHFAVLSNLLVAISLSVMVFRPESVFGRFFANFLFQSGLVLYVCVAGLVYNLVIRGAITLSPGETIANDLLHVVIPVFYVLYWLKFTPRGVLKWHYCFCWLIIPFCYLVYTLTRGAVVNWYPYQFLNPHVQAIDTFITNIFHLSIVFLLGGFVLVVINQIQRQKTEPGQVCP